jgi:hypothetical protein
MNKVPDIHEWGRHGMPWIPNKNRLKWAAPNRTMWFPHFTKYGYSPRSWKILPTTHIITFRGPSTDLTMTGRHFINRPIQINPSQCYTYNADVLYVLWQELDHDHEIGFLVAVNDIL